MGIVPNFSYHFHLDKK